MLKITTVKTTGDTTIRKEVKVYHVWTAKI